MKQNISVLGSTGSIGVQTLDVARKMGIKVCALAARQNIRLLEKQIREFRPKLAAVFEEEAASQLRAAVADLDVAVVSRMDGLCEAASISSADLICNSVVGMVGLEPTLAAIAAGKDLALSNKETLVAGGALVMKRAQEKQISILPVDSEHSAIFQCLQGAPAERSLNKILLTASGGPFFGKKREELENVTVEQALNHPNWDMGAKITVDSSTMMNKGLEIIEASWLFGVPQDKIEVVVHRESIIHSMVEYNDFSVIAQMGVPDMRIPIQYAITYPQRMPSPVRQLDLTEIGKLTFFKPDTETFSCLSAAREALRKGGLAAAVMNGANEAAVALFLNGRISFLRIGELVWEAMEHLSAKEESISLQEILEADHMARAYVENAIE